MKKLRKTMALVLSGVLVLTTLSACGSSKKNVPNGNSSTTKIAIKYNVVYPPTGTQADGAAALGKFMKDYSGGKIDFKFFPSSQLGDKIPTLEALRAGTIEMTECTASDLSNFSKMWSVFSLPYMFNSGADAIKVVNDPTVSKILNDDAEAMGFKIIGWWNMGERNILNSKRPVQNPEDLKGLKIRVMQDPILAKAINAMGASGTPMAWSDVYTGVQQKTIDGLENSAPVITANKLQEVAKYMSLTQQFIIPDPQLMSKKVFDSLSADTQQAILKAGKSSEEQFNSMWDKAVLKDMDTLKASGVKVNEVNKDAFKAAVKPMVDGYMKTADDKTKALYNAIMAVKK